MSTPDANTPKSYTDAELAQAVKDAKEQAAKDERSKLYGRIDDKDSAVKAMKEELAELQREQKKRDAEAEKARKAQEAAVKKAAEADMDAKQLIEAKAREMDEARKQLEDDWSKRFETQGQELAKERAIREQERRFSDLRAYAQRRVAEEGDNIEPNLVDLINGNTEAEIDASIETIKAKSLAILNSAQQFFQGQRAAMPGSAPTGNTPSGPLEMLDNQQVQALTGEDISAMGMNDFAQLREKLGIGGGNQNQGMFRR